MRLRGWRHGLSIALAITGAATCLAELTNVVLIPSGAACRYLVPTNNALGTNWTALGFNDASWSNGISGIGYDTDVTYAPLLGTRVPVGTVSFYSRFSFQLASTSNFVSLTLRMKYDDGFVAYLNGTKVAEANGPTSTNYNATASGNHPDNLAVLFEDFDLSGHLARLRNGTNLLAIWGLNTSASSSDLLILPELVAEQGTLNVILVTNIVISEFMAINDATITNRLGKYADWIEIHNRATNATSLVGWHLTDDADNLTKWTFPHTNIAAGGFVLVWADDKSYAVTNGELHANFKLDGDGEYLALVQPDGQTVAYAYEPRYPPQYADISYGIGAVGEHRYFGRPTPGVSNNFASVSGQVAAVEFNVAGGWIINFSSCRSHSARSSGSTPAAVPVTLRPAVAGLRPRTSCPHMTRYCRRPIHPSRNGRA